LTSRTLEEFERQAGILGITVQDNSKFAETIVNASFHNATWSDRIWANQEYLKAELNKTLSNGLIQGLNPRALAPSIAKSCGVSKKNALRLMRTELARVQTQAQVEAYNRNCFDEYIFLAERTACTECLAINGKVFKVADAEAGDNLPPIHPNCRCSTAAYIDEKAYDQWLEAKANGETSASFEEWRQSNDTTEKIATGARILDPNSESAVEWAKGYYEEIRHKSTDCKKISEKTGIPIKDVKKIKEYLFVNGKYMDSNGVERSFYADPAIAQSWQRLAEGKEILPHDLTMLNHELLEMEIKKNNPNISHEDAHDQASLVYNYAEEVKEYYATRKKRKSQ
jgi:SPP1 gp7 family putative phage head morphogenesis protein